MPARSKTGLWHGGTFQGTNKCFQEIFFPLWENKKPNQENLKKQDTHFDKNESNDILQQTQ